MVFYTVNSDYLDFLRTLDNKIPMTTGASYSHTKPFIGIVLEVGSHKFLAPMSSPKPWHDNVKNSCCTIFKICNRLNEEEKLGIVALKFMFPIIESEINPLDIESLDRKYKNLLYKEFEYIKINKSKIKSKAQKLYSHLVEKRTKHYMEKSCDITKLIDNYRNFDME